LILGLSDEIPDQVELHERYSREVAFVDKHVGALLDSLKARDWYEESLIIFTSDHGEALGEKDYVGHIHTLYDSMLKVPLIIKPPRSLGNAAGQRRGDLAGLVDITPTILACLDIDLPPLGRGRDLLARKAANSDAQLYCETHAPQAFHTLYGLRGSDYKIIFTPDQNRYELYDLVQDPQETLDMNTDDERLAREWQQMLEKFQEELAARAEGEADVEVDEETQRQLRALGY
jgi:arylsulfatase A-like enzyme